MSINHEHLGSARLAAFGLASSMAGQVPALQDVTEQGQLISVVISIVTSIIALIKLLRKKK